MTDINESIRKRGFHGNNPQARIKEFEALSVAEGLSVKSFLDIPVILVDKPTFRRLAVTL